MEDLMWNISKTTGLIISKFDSEDKILLVGEPDSSFTKTELFQFSVSDGYTYQSQPPLG